MADLWESAFPNDTRCTNSTFKMKNLAFIILAIGFSVVVNGIVCPEDYCSKVDCSPAPTISSCKGELVPYSAGFCGCCTACITRIPPGGDCIHLPFIGVPPPFYRTECVYTHICSRGKCVPN